MLRKFLTLSCAIVAVMGAVSIMASYDSEQNYISREKFITPDNSNTVSVPQYSKEVSVAAGISEAGKIESGYVLMQCENGIAVYKSGEDNPYQTIEFNVESLPQEDKRMLIGGIYVSDDKELQALIEDYTG